MSQLEMRLEAVEMKLEKNRQEHQLGMREMRELSKEANGNMQAWQSDGADLRSLAQEVKDQQEAMVALMDMLEKTITVEVSVAKTRL